MATEGVDEPQALLETLNAGHVLGRAVAFVELLSVGADRVRNYSYRATSCKQSQAGTRNPQFQKQASGAVRLEGRRDRSLASEDFD
eukprot:141564-Alexandrium_andersonii.AAC.1